MLLFLHFSAFPEEGHTLAGLLIAVVPEQSAGVVQAQRPSEALQHNSLLDIPAVKAGIQEMGANIGNFPCSFIVGSKKLPVVGFTGAAASVDVDGVVVACSSDFHKAPPAAGTSLVVPPSTSKVHGFLRRDGGRFRCGLRRLEQDFRFSG